MDQWHHRESFYRGSYGMDYGKVDPHLFELIGTWVFSDNLRI